MSESALMAQLPLLILAALAGIVLGGMFFGGLWWTLRRGLASRRPALWFCGGLALRMGIAVTGFCLVSGGDWARLLACLSGFLLARVAATRLLGPSPDERDAVRARPGHAA